MDARRVGGAPRFHELVVYFGEEGEGALAEDLIAPQKKPLVQPAARMVPQAESPSSLTAFVITRMSSSSTLSLTLREADQQKLACQRLLKSSAPLFL